MEKTTQELNLQLGNLLASVETRAKEVAEEQRQGSKLAQTQRELLAMYSAVEPVLKEVTRLEKELRPFVVRVGPALAVLEGEGVDSIRISATRRILGELDLRLTTIPSQLKAIPGLIEELQEYDSLGNVFGAAEIQQQLRNAASGRSPASIRALYAQLVTTFEAASKSKRRAVIPIKGQEPEFEPETPKVETDFPVFG